MAKAEFDVEFQNSDKLKDRYDMVLGVDNLFDQLYEQACGLPREGRVILLTLRGRF